MLLGLFKQYKAPLPPDPHLLRRLTSFSRLLPERLWACGSTHPARHSFLKGSDANDYILITFALRFFHFGSGRSLSASLAGAAVLYDRTGPAATVACAGHAGQFQDREVLARLLASA